MILSHHSSAARLLSEDTGVSSLRMVGAIMLGTVTMIYIFLIRYATVTRRSKKGSDRPNTRGPLSDSQALESMLRATTTSSSSSSARSSGNHEGFIKKTPQSLPRPGVTTLPSLLLSPRPTRSSNATSSEGSSLASFRVEKSLSDDPPSGEEMGSTGGLFMTFENRRTHSWPSDEMNHTDDADDDLIAP